MVQAQYKLTYFDGKGAAETARQLFVLAGQDFKDVRLNREQFADYKSKAPFGQLPVLEVNGQLLGQSVAINRYLAKSFGFAGKDAWEQAVVDSLGDQWKDFGNEIRPFQMVLYGYGTGDKETLRQEVLLPAIRKVLGLFTNFLTNSPSGFLVGKYLTWIDLTVAESVAGWIELAPEVLEYFPEFVAHMERVHAIPRIAKWRAAHP